jgi:hypothetical protein
MNREQVRKVVERANVRVVTSDPHGITLRRANHVTNVSWSQEPTPWRICRTGIGGCWLEQQWRLCCGSGIAGHSGEWWLQYIGPTAERIGPFRTVKALEKVLRSWNRWETP